MWTELKPFVAAAAPALAFVALELLFPAYPRAAFRWRRYATDLLHMTVGSALVHLGVAVSLALVLALLFIKNPGTSAGQLPWWPQLVLILLISDFLIWFTHRLFHTVPWLWEFHKIHHSSENLDWLAAYRFHPVDQILTTTAVMLPGILLGFSSSAIAAYSLGYGLHSLLLHSNVRFSLGPLGYVINVPRMHHWHHAAHVEAYDRNFGAQLLIWDRLFGTLYNPPRPLPQRYGVDDPPKESFLVHLRAPFTKGTARSAVTPAYQD